MLNITTQTLINGSNVTALNQDQLFDLVAQAEKEVKRLGDIESKPNALKKKISDLKDSIAELVKISDAKSEK